MAQGNLKLEQLDVNTTFQHGELEERMYISNLKVLFRKVMKTKCLLKKLIYGLKQSLRL